MLKELNLEPFKIRRPLKIRWMYDQQQASFLDGLKSKSLRAFLKKTVNHLQDNQIHVEHQSLDDQLYQKWFAYYQENMIKKNYDVIATSDWLTKKVTEKKEVKGFFLTQNRDWVGTLIYTVQDKKRGIACFKTTIQLPEFYQKNHSLSAILDYLFVQEMETRHIPWISLGSMRNAFGVINTIGNLDYKLRCGYYPIIEDQSERVESVPLDENGRVVFFGEHDNQLQLFIAHPKDQPFTSELIRFESDIISIRYLPYT